MTSYLEAERGSRGETPGALTYSERLARQWIYGRRYDAEELRDRYSRATSVARGEGVAAAASKSVSFLESEMAARSARAVSELRATSSSLQKSSTTATATSASTSQSLLSQRQQLLSSSQKSTQVSSSVAKSSSVQQSQSQAISSSRYESKQKIQDDVCKKIADIRMSPWSEGQELSEAQAASARARSRIMELERELEEITRKAMTSQTKALKTAKQMAMEASLEDEATMAASTKKSKKIIMESSSKIVSA